MYTQKPIIWYDTNRISVSDANRIKEAYSNSMLVPSRPGDGPPMGRITPRYPTPDELFRWRHKEVDKPK